MRSLYIANRGEIACRIIRTAQSMGIHTIVGYSEADQNSLFKNMADEAHSLGGSAPDESYLNTGKILGLIKKTGADALHPGYGFLSENAVFAKQVIDAGCLWVGPSPACIDTMGDKEKARDTMKKYHVPLVPGISDLQTYDEIANAANEIGYPILLKAAMGGGGIGMRIVSQESELGKALEETQSRAQRAFGSDRVFVEKLIENPHHVEVQLFGTNNGQIFVLPERECSVQRRHQKVAEESPSPFATAASREALNAAAKAGAGGIHYQNAGTMEFLLGGDQSPYFLEVNTRLQVEHPVTEMICGIDLVELQLRTAAGEDVSAELEKIQAKGHAIEFRLYAENPKNFYPSPGTIQKLVWPEGDGIRIDTGVQEGDTITPFYDPMVAKIIVHGADRAAAVAKMSTALAGLTIEGLKTNLPFLQELITLESFVVGLYDTSILYQLRPKLRGKA